MIVSAKAWYNMKKNVAHLRVFGAIVYIHIFPDLHLSKLEPRATHLIFIGYFSTRSHKLLDKSTR